MKATSQISNTAVELSRKKARVPMVAMVRKLMSHAPRSAARNTPSRSGDEGSAPGSTTTSVRMASGRASAARRGSAERFSAL